MTLISRNGMQKYSFLCTNPTFHSTVTSHPLRCCILAYSNMLLPLLLLLDSTLGIQGACAAMLEQHSNIIHNAVPSACQTATTTTVAGLGQRSLRELLWSCFIAIAVSSVVSIHPNVPPRDAKTQSSHGTFKRIVLILWTLAAPEIVMLWAMRQWIGAKRIAEEFKGAYQCLFPCINATMCPCV